MNRILKNLILSLSVLYLISCTDDSLTAKQETLKKLKAEAMELEARITRLEKELEQAGALHEENQAHVLVATLPLERGPFVHEVEVRGSVQSRKNVLISAETMGRVKRILVEEGQAVRTGTVLVNLDDEILRNTISEVETSLELAEAVFVRQKNLWDQQIGTEIQFLQARNNRDALQKRLTTLRTQLRQYQVKAPFAGTVDDVIVRVGEMAQPGVPLIRIVNPDEMYIKADISEAYLGKFERGDKATVYFPVQDRKYEVRITSVSRVINAKNRTFTIELTLPRSAEMDYQPNQVAVLRLTDYANDSALTVPTRLIQADTHGKYVYVVAQKEGQSISLKKRVVTGLSYESRTEILDGLTLEDRVIDKGYRYVNEGTEIQIAGL